MYEYYDRIRYKYQVNNNEFAQVVAATIYTYKGCSGKVNKYAKYLLDTGTEVFEYYFKTLDVELMDINDIGDSNPLRMVFSIAKEHLNFVGCTDSDIYGLKRQLAKELDQYSNISLVQQDALVMFLDYLFMFKNDVIDKKFKTEIVEEGEVYKSMTPQEILQNHYINRGERNKAIKMALEMLKDNEPISKIVKYTELSEEEILELKNP